MNLKINELDDCAIEINNDKKFSALQIDQIFGKYGKIIKIISNDQNQIIYFNSHAEAKRCASDSENLIEKIREIKLEMDCVGDTVCQSKNLSLNKMKKVLKNFTQEKLKTEQFNLPSSSSSDPDKYIPNCSTPVLLNTVEPGFRLAYCHNLTNVKTDSKVNRLTQFNQSIKKYIDNTPRVGSHEIVLTNLPPNFKKEDIYKLCGKIEPAAVELKTTSNINILYANVTAKSKDDFEKLTEVLVNRQVNGIRITTIPITKISRPLSGSSD